MSAAHEEEWALDGQVEEAPVDPNQAVEETAGQEAPELNDIEQLAVELGWKPESEWKGPKDGWTPADQYLRATHQKHAAASERAREATRHLRASQRSYDELQQRMERLTKTTTQLAREQEERHRAEIERFFEAKKKEAAKEGNDELYDDLVDQQRQAERALDEKFKPEPDVDYTQQAQEMLADPLLGKFFREHPFVVQDEDAYAYVFAIAQDLADAGYPKSAQIQAAKQALREEFPHYFQKPANAPTHQRKPQAPADDDAGELEDQPWNVEAAAAATHDTPPQDPETGRFVPRKDAHLYQQPAQQMRRPAPQMQTGSRMPVSARAQSPEQKAWNALPAEAREVFKAQKASGAFKGDIVRFAKIFNGDTSNVLD